MSEIKRYLRYTIRLIFMLLLLPFMPLLALVSVAMWSFGSEEPFEAVIDYLKALKP